MTKLMHSTAWYLPGVYTGYISGSYLIFISSISGTCIVFIYMDVCLGPTRILHNTKLALTSQLFAYWLAYLTCTYLFHIVYLPDVYQTFLWSSLLHCIYRVCGKWIPCKYLVPKVGTHVHLWSSYSYFCKLLLHTFSFTLCRIMTRY